MKNIIVGIALLLASPAAFSKTITTYTFGTGLEVNGARMVQVDLHDTGLLKVKAAGFNDEANAEYAQTQLAKSTMSKIVADLGRLADAKVKTTISQFVCMTFVAPIPQGPQSLYVASGYEFATQKFKGPLRLVKSPDGCYLRTHTAPVDSFNKQFVDKVEQALTVLALQALANN